MKAMEDFILTGGDYPSEDLRVRLASESQDPASADSGLPDKDAPTDDPAKRYEWDEFDEDDYVESNDKEDKP